MVGNAPQLIASNNSLCIRACESGRAQEGCGQVREGRRVGALRVCAEIRGAPRPFAHLFFRLLSAVKPAASTEHRPTKGGSRWLGCWQERAAGMAVRTEEAWQCAQKSTSCSIRRMSVSLHTCCACARQRRGGTPHSALRYRHDRPGQPRPDRPGQPRPHRQPWPRGTRICRTRLESACAGSCLRWGEAEQEPSAEERGERGERRGERGCTRAHKDGRAKEETREEEHPQPQSAVQARQESRTS